MKLVCKFSINKNNTVTLVDAIDNLNNLSRDVKEYIEKIVDITSSVEESMSHQLEVNSQVTAGMNQLSNEIYFFKF